MVAGGQLVFNFVPRLIEIEDFDIAARGHDILDGDIVQVEQARQDGAVFLRNEMRGFKNQATQFLGRELCIFILLCR